MHSVACSYACASTRTLDSATEAPVNLKANRQARFCETAGNRGNGHSQCIRRCRVTSTRGYLNPPTISTRSELGAGPLDESRFASSRISASQSDVTILLESVCRRSSNRRAARRRRGVGLSVLLAAATGAIGLLSGWAGASLKVKGEKYHDEGGVSRNAPPE